MSFADSIRTCFSKYATFSGRARRSELWFFVLFVAIVQTVLGIVASVLGASAILSDPAALSAGTAALPAGVVAVYGIMGLFSLAVLLPTIAVSVRRLHDTDRSGALWLLSFIPVVNLVLIVFYALEGTAGANRFGADPKGAGVTTEPTPAAV